MKIIAKNEEEKKQILEFSKYMHDYRVYKSKKGVTSIRSTENGKDKKRIVKNEQLWFFKDGDNDVQNYIAHLYNSPELVQVDVMGGEAHDPNFGDSRLCTCGHTYYRHFDSYENMAPVGCKYSGHCNCEGFKDSGKIERWDHNTKIVEDYKK